MPETLRPECQLRRQQLHTYTVNRLTMNGSSDDDILPPPKDVKLKNPWVAVGALCTMGPLV